MHLSHTLLADGTFGAAQVLFGVIGAAAGAAIVWFLLDRRARAQQAARKAEADALLSAARDKADERLREAEVEARKRHVEVMERFERETAETRTELKAAEKRITHREDALDKKLDVLVTKEKKLETAEAAAAARERELENRSKAVEELHQQQRAELLRIAKLSPDQARAMCLKRIEQEVEADAGQLIDRAISTAEDTARDRARHIIIGAIQRYAAQHTVEATVATIDVQNDEMKGRVIGREGRNIRAFEKVTGAQVIVDDTPGVVMISCTDPVRKEKARHTLDRLIRDGRIHPTRIEELYADVEREVEQRVVEAGKQAAAEANVHGVNKKVLDMLGRLQFRTSYGQNVLKHSVEVAHLCGLMAEELGLDGPLARRCGLLHDIGKAITHEEAEGSHTKTGFDFAKRFSEPPPVLNAIAGHHGDVPASHPYTPLVTAADAISAARPGSRRESLERYVKRLQDLEAVATSFGGVRQAYAIEAGREVRVIVDPVRIDDRSSLKLARDIAKKIEETLVTFPGEIRVTVLRELRATEFAVSGRGRSDERRAPMSFSAADEEPPTSPDEETAAV